MMAVAEKVEFFTDFRVVDGSLTANDLYDNVYMIKEIVRRGNGDTVVVYYDGDDEIETLQTKGNYHTYREY